MINIRKSETKVLAAAISIISITAIAVWQFHLFVTYGESQGIAGMSGGTHRLWWAVGAGLVACVASFYMFLVFARYDSTNEMPIIVYDGFIGDKMRDSLYAMRRADGDWFAMDKGGCLHVPVFHSSFAAVRAHRHNSGMILFKPTVLDERALKDFAPVAEASDYGFWLIDDPSADLSRGQPLNHAQLTLLVRKPIELQPAPPTGTGVPGLSTLTQNDSHTAGT